MICAKQFSAFLLVITIVYPVSGRHIHQGEYIDTLPNVIAVQEIRDVSGIIVGNELLVPLGFIIGDRVTDTTGTQIDDSTFTGPTICRDGEIKDEKSGQCLKLTEENYVQNDAQKIKTLNAILDSLTEVNQNTLYLIRSYVSTLTPPSTLAKQELLAERSIGRDAAIVDSFISESETLDSITNIKTLGIQIPTNTYNHVHMVDRNDFKLDRQ